MQELLYTSVPRGLKPGSRGFSTVLSTQGMVAPLAAALEALSGYRPVFPIGHARVAENPVVYSHLKLQVAGKSWYVLSRVADYGLDYSQRTNKLAHHLVLDKSELTAAGPASLLRASGIMRESWEGEPKIVPPKPIARETSAPSGVCEAWKTMTGDAGWAGVLAESFLKDPARPVILLFEPGQDLRPLIDESLSLLPSERRWDVTFSTYFTGSSQGITCLWRGIVLGSKEATESLRFVNALRIDLTSTDIGRAEGGELVDAARKGIRLTARPTLSPKQTASREQQEPRVVVMDNAAEPTVSRTSYEEADTETHAAPAASHEHSQAPPRLTRSAFKFANARRQTDEDDPRVRTSRGRRFIIPLLIILLVGGFVVAIVALNRHRANSIALVTHISDQPMPQTSDGVNSQAAVGPPAVIPPAVIPPATIPPETAQYRFLDYAIKVTSKEGEERQTLKKETHQFKSTESQSVRMRLVPPRNDFPIRGGVSEDNKLSVSYMAKEPGGGMPQPKPFAELVISSASDLTFKRTTNQGSDKAAVNLTLCLLELSVQGSPPILIAMNSNQRASISENVVQSDRLKHAYEANVGLLLHDVVIDYRNKVKESVPSGEQVHNDGKLTIPIPQSEKKIEVEVILGKPDSKTGQVRLDVATTPSKDDAENALSEKVDELKGQLEKLIKAFKDKKQPKFDTAATALEKVVMNLKGHRKVSNETIEMAVGKPIAPGTPGTPAVLDEVRKVYDETNVPKIIKDCESFLASKDLVDSLANAKVVRATVKYEVMVHEADNPISVDLLKIRGN